MVKKFDAATLKKLRITAKADEPAQPTNGAVTPSRERTRDAVRDANDPRRLTSVITPQFSRGRS